MKVYAEFIAENNIGYRKTTILQFGDTWDLIGSAVLKNPGSASPRNSIDDETFKNILKINDGFCKENWFEFKDDATMRYLEKIFNGNYIGEKKELNGIILLFNLFNIKEKNLQNALGLAENNFSGNLYQDSEEVIQLFKNKPVFLGWNYLYTNPKIKVNRAFAERIFDYVKQGKFMYLKDEMMENYFYHPMYIQLKLNGNDNIKETLKSFYSYLN